MTSRVKPGEEGSRYLKMICSHISLPIFYSFFSKLLWFTISWAVEKKDWLYCFSFAVFSCRVWGAMLRGNFDILRIPSAWNQLRSGGLGVTEQIVLVCDVMSWICHAPFPEPASAREWVWVGSRSWMLQMPLGPFSLLQRSPFWGELPRVVLFVVVVKCLGDSLRPSLEGQCWVRHWLILVTPIVNKCYFLL